MNKPWILAAIAASGTLMTVLIVPQARAAEAASETAADEDNGGLQEIVVTANKREESIQKVPISMTAVAGEALAEMHIDNVKDLGLIVPGLQIKNEFGVATPLSFIRGIGNTSFVATSIMPVGFYVDGVYVGQNIAQGLQLFDTDRIEVLRGPQGTLFGRNTTGGLINVVTRKPKLDGSTTADFHATVGDYGTLNADGAVGGSISPSLAFRASASRQGDHGVYKNVNPDYLGSSRHVGKIDADAARLQLLWGPTDSLTALLGLHWGKSDGENIPNKPGFLAADPATNCPAGAVSGGFQNGCSDPYGFGVTDVPGYHSTAEAAPGIEHVKAYGPSAEVNWNLGSTLLTWVGAWDKATLDRFHDSDGQPLAFVNSTFSADVRFWSSELRLTSQQPGPWNWVAGLYYYGDKNRSFTHFNSAELFGGAGVAQAILQKTSSYSIFGEASYRFAERWKLTAGLRETSDKRTAGIETWTTNAFGIFTDPAVPVAFLPAVSATEIVSEADARAAFLGPLIPPTTQDETWKKWSGRLSLSYDLDDDRLIYASASRGFKGGEFNGSALIFPQEATLSDPEYMDSYELGFKGTELDGKMRTNLAIFDMEYKNQQVLVNVSANGALFGALTNVGQSRIRGAEFDLQVRPSTAWFFSLGGSYLDAKFTQFEDPVAGDRSGNRLPEAPKWSFTGLVRYQHALTNGTLGIQADGNWNASRFFTVENRPALRTGAYGLLNARVSYGFMSDRAEIAIFAKNVLNHDYLSSGFDIQTFGENVFQPGRPRLVGVDFSYHFD